MKMHDISTDDDDYKLPLRPWLKNHIDRNTFEGLEWINVKELIFKIPWTKKGHPGWEKDYEVFKYWAIHRGKYDETAPPDYNRWKGNFRSVLHKSEDFREIKEKSITNQQTGNYRVFQILPSSEVKENRKRPRTNVSDDVPPVTTKLKKQPTAVAMPTSSVAIEPATSSQIIQSDAIMPYTTSSFEQQAIPAIGDFSDSISFIDSMVPVDSATYQLPSNSTVPALESQSNGPNLAGGGEVDYLPAFSLSEVQQCLDSDPTEALPGTKIENFVSDEYLNSDQPVFCDLAPVTSKELPKESTKLREFMESKNFSREQLTKILLTVKYGEKIRICQEYLDLSQGYRILYGDAEVQLEAVAANGKKIDDFALPTKELPQYTGDNEKIIESLKYAELGLVLWANEKGKFFAKRLCQSRIWLIDNTPIKMNRKSPIEVFSYSKYVENVFQYVTSPTSGKIIFTIGEKPPSLSVNLVKIVIEPILAPHIEHFFSKGNTGDASSLCYSSEESSVDKIIRMFSMQTIEK